MDIKVDQKTIEREVTNRVIDWFIEEDEILDEIRNGINERLDKVFAEKATQMVEQAAEKAFNEAFERSYQRVDEYGTPTGDPTTIKAEMNRMVGDYWSTRVDRNGNFTNSPHSSTTRAEYLMQKICAEDFSKTLQQSAQNITGSLKDGLRDQLAKHTDDLLDGLFRVRSLQDQGKVEKR